MEKRGSDPPAGCERQTFNLRADRREWTRIQAVKQKTSAGKPVEEAIELLKRERKLAKRTGSTDSRYFELWRSATMDQIESCGDRDHGPALVVSGGSCRRGISASVSPVVRGR